MRALFGLILGLVAGAAIAMVLVVAAPTPDGAEAVGTPTLAPPMDTDLTDREQPRLPRLTSDTEPPQPPEPPGLE